MDIVTKDASITNTSDEGPGSFEVILSAPTLDRDGDTLLPEDWKQPLPDHITFDSDHQMSVAGTVGSGAPTLDDDGNLVVRGTYSSLPRAQEVRTLVNEGHIRTTSVAFMSSKSTKDGKTRVTRELLNGAFVAIPSNRESVILASKGLKAGARNSKSDSDLIQTIHDAAVQLGATPAGGPDGGDETTTAQATEKRVRMVAAKSVPGSYEDRAQAISDALDSRYPGDDIWAYPIATFDDNVVYRVSGSSDLRGQWQCTYTIEDDGTVTLGDAQRVTMVEQVVPVKNFAVDPTANEPAGDQSAAADDAAAQAAAKSAAADATAVQEVHIRAARLRALATLSSLEGES